VEAAGTSYADFTTVIPEQQARKVIDFSRFVGIEARLVAVAAASGTGTRGYQMIRDSDSDVMCLVEWTGTGAARRIGSWTRFNWDRVDTNVHLQRKGGTAATITTRYVELQIRGRNIGVAGA